MMMSNEDIKRAIRSGELVLNPFSEKWVRGSGVTLHLGENLLKPLPGVTIDIKNNTLPSYQAITIGADQPCAIQPGEFLLGHTYQVVTVGSSLGFLIEGRSTLARLGLTIVQTAMLVYPGHRNRTVTLELANHGPNAILLYPKMKIARAALFELRTPSSDLYDDSGKYREQDLVGKPIFSNEFMEED